MTERSLDHYRAKRDPARTPEPFGFVQPPPSRVGRVHRFVIQQHAARRLHWDFRLEIDGVLVSWAVPRGPAVDPQQKRLAVQTEDHPLEYGDFEGLIPAGNYGAGAVIVWDNGTYECVDDVTPAQGLRRGKLDIAVHGHKLRGRWALVRTKGGDGKQWLLFKKAEATATAKVEPVIAQPGSVFSGLTVDELQRGVTRTAELAQQAKAAGAARRSLDRAALSPMLAETAPQPFSRAGWLFELKHDGVRALVVRATDGAVRLLSRSGRDVTATFPEVAKAAAHLPCGDFVLDGEIVALNERGVSSFERLQQRLGQTNAAAVARAAIEVPVVLYLFDLLAVAGYDLRALALTTRKDLLRRLIPAAGVLRYSDHIERDGEALFVATVEHELEGIIAKRADSRYVSGRRSRDWLKIKAQRTADLAVVGYLPGKGSRKDLGALMLAWRGDDGLEYAGNVGSGFDAKTIKTTLAQLESARRSQAAFEAVKGDLDRAAVFVEPELVAEVRYSEVTERGYLRQPVFLRLRDDKRIDECDARPRARAAVEPVAADPAPTPPELRLSNLEKIFWPADGYTKGDLLKYYEQIWPQLAPYLRDRPVVLTRYPDGIDGKNFFQKNAPEFTPDWVTTYRIEDTDFFLCNDLNTLLYVINSGCIPLHVWSARTSSLDRPDWTILDLDPKGAPFSHVVTVAKHIHKLLEPLAVPHFVKTSGQEGLHILIPLAATLTHDQAKTFAELLARMVAADLPDITTVARPLNERGGKVYVDFLQNGFGKTIAGPFSVRPRLGAPVSTPVEWREVSARLDPSRFTIKTVPGRFAKRADPMRGVLDTRVDVAAVLAALTERMNDR
ncbi:MAG TPA: DNA ligase D [Candidatus Kryptonia bacterium]|nr:DNA ligase D [Candidatus Kryptonia bacterium]